MRSATEKSIQKANKSLLDAIRKLPQQPLVVASVLAGFAFFGSFFLLSSQAAAPGNEAAYFALESPGQSKPFIITLNDPEKIQSARTFATNTWTVSGSIVKEKADYNANWSYYLDPETIEFVQESSGSCDAAPTFVEQNLSKVGDSVLPENRWCPSGITSLREVTK